MINKTTYFIIELFSNLLKGVIRSNQIYHTHLECTKKMFVYKCICLSIQEIVTDYF